MFTSNTIRQTRKQLASHTLQSVHADCNKALPDAIRIGNYNIYKADDNDLFTGFSHVALRESLSTGWKAHISVSPNELDIVYRLITPILEKYNVLQFKFTDINRMREYIDSAESQKEIESGKRLHDGMQITIYMREGQEENFNFMFYEIEELLQAENITPGVIDSSDRKIGQFVSVRNQAFKQYVPVKKGDPYNPIDVKDPFIDLAEIKKTVPLANPQFK